MPCSWRFSRSLSQPPALDFPLVTSNIWRESTHQSNARQRQQTNERCSIRIAVWSLHGRADHCAPPRHTPRIMASAEKSNRFIAKSSSIMYCRSYLRTRLLDYCRPIPSLPRQAQRPRKQAQAYQNLHTYLKELSHLELFES
jgi:hypothetical protein